MTVLAAPALAVTPETSGTCRHCGNPIAVCPVKAEGNITYCGGWIHVPGDGRSFGRHSCGDGTHTQAQPEINGKTGE